MVWSNFRTLDALHCQKLYKNLLIELSLFHTSSVKTTKSDEKRDNGDLGRKRKKWVHTKKK